tara:strand:+ start:41742 stop:41996 length:255 start_codon:yes stop_codon:yes gene_type:complete
MKEYRPKHYPKIPCEPQEWASCHKPEDVKIYDIFTTLDGSRCLVNEIRQITKHAIYETIWEFVCRDSGRIYHFNEFKYKYCDEV